MRGGERGRTPTPRPWRPKAGDLVELVVGAVPEDCTGAGARLWERIRAEAEITNDRLQTWTADIPYPTATTLAEALAGLQQDAAA